MVDGDPHAGPALHHLHSDHAKLLLGCRGVRLVVEGNHFAAPGVIAHRAGEGHDRPGIIGRDQGFDQARVERRIGDVEQLRQGDARRR